MTGYRLFALASFLAMLGATTVTAERTAAKHAFAPILSSLAKSGVPALLPGKLPGPDLVNATAQLESAGSKGYAIELALAPDCNGATACHIGEVAGSKSDGSTLKGSKVTLPSGVTGYVVLSACGASCSDSSITFDRDGYRYVFSEKAGSKADLVEFASSIVTPAQLEAE
jgi:hypothetical protein